MTLKYYFITSVLLVFAKVAFSQPVYDYSKPFIATSQLGFRTSSPKEVTFFGGNEVEKLPNEIPFFITKVGYRLPRAIKTPKAWGNPVFRWPFDVEKAPYTKQVSEDSVEGLYLYKGILKKMDTRWGVMWRGDFSDFEAPGNYQLECEYAFSVPFQIDDKVYERLERGYLEYMYTQRSGVEIPGIRPVENADDGRLYTDTTYYMPVAGGWNDAGDWRKWLFLTLPNLDALGQIARFGHPAFKQKAIAEMVWGNQYFHHMITDEGRVYEDVGAGKNRAGDYDKTWWNENHPGVTAAGDLVFDNIPMNGIERHVRTNYNPLVQFQFVRHQALASTIMEPPYQNNCLVLADRAWKYGQKVGHDERTIFIAQSLLAGIELYLAGGVSVSKPQIKNLASKLLERQEIAKGKLSGYFMEKDKTDGYRSIAFNAEPALALLRLCEAQIDGIEEEVALAKKAVTSYINDYVLADASKNPFHVPPYGIYVDPPFPKSQKFRAVGTNRYARTFIHVYSPNPMPHGINAGILQAGYLMARAGTFFDKQHWQDAAEKVLQWTSGHNNFGMCLYTGVGFKHPVPASFVNYKIPSGVLIGFLGREDDSPYLETSNAVEWSTQEVWDVPYFYTIGLISYLK
ncbi:MAG: glycoside hydrolase family 9 protein [Bacteroidota bacterium]